MLRTRLLLGFVLLLVLLSAVGAYAVWTTQELGRSVAAVVVANARSLVQAQQLKGEVTRLGAALRQLRSADTPGARADFAAAGDACKVMVRRELGAQEGGAARAQCLAELDAALQRLSGRPAGPANTLRPLELMKADEAAVYAVLSAIDRLAGLAAGDLRLAEEKARQLTLRTTVVFGAGVTAAVLLAFVFAWGLGRALLQPIRQLTASAVALGEGNLDQAVPVKSRDELGQLARTFNGMAAKLRAYREAMAEKAQRAQRAMEATLTSAPDPLFVVARDGIQVVRNPAAEALAATADYGSGFPEAIDRRLQEVLRTGGHYLPADYGHIVTIGGRHYLPRIIAIGDRLTDFRGAALILQDVTKFRLLDDAKTNLVGTVSHELKTPLTSLRMAVYLLLEARSGNLSAMQQELLEQARDDADRLLRILNDLLDLARIESGVAAPRLEVVDAAVLLADIAKEMGPVLSNAGLALVVQAPARALPVPVDRESIRHVFTNLLTNASKYAPAKSQVELYALPADEGFVRFGVRDQGPGIAEEHQARIFEKFYRVPGQEIKGFGLGLAICREIVVAHGGSIACTSTPGQGCDFHFVLPVGRG